MQPTLLKAAQMPPTPQAGAPIPAAGWEGLILPLAWVGIVGTRPAAAAWGPLSDHSAVQSRATLQARWELNSQSQAPCLEASSRFQTSPERLLQGQGNPSSRLRRPLHRSSSNTKAPARHCGAARMN